MSIASRINEIETHLLDDYSVLTLAGADLTGVNKNIVNLKMSWKERLLYFMNNGTDDVWNNWTKVNGTGTTLSLNNTEEAPMSLVYKGNTSQEGTPTPESPQDIHVVSGDNSIEVVGKNLFDIGTSNQDYIRGENPPTFLTVNDSSLSMVIQSVGGTYFYRNQKQKGNNTFTISFKAPDRYFRLYVRIRNADDTNWLTSNDFTPSESGWTYNTYYGGWYYEFITVSSSTIYEKTITIPNCSYWLIGFGANTVVGQGTTQTLSNIMLEKGTQATTYEEYKGASYPISLGDKELCKIGTCQDKIDKSSGKNLFDGVFRQGSENNPLNTQNVFSQNILQLEAGTYTFSTNLPMTSFKYAIGTNSTGFPGTATYIDGFHTTSSFTFTLSEAKYVGIMVNKNNNTMTPSDVASYHFMLVNGTDTTYEPYGTGWYLKKEIGKVVLNGSENWGNDGQSRGYTTNFIDYHSTNALCNISIYEPTTTTWTEIGKFGLNAFGVCWFRLDTTQTDFSNVTNWKNWLTTNNAIIYYVLATPTYEPITDTTLLSQLEAIKKSYESVTNINQVNNDLPFELSVTALEVMS